MNHHPAGIRGNWRTTDKSSPLSSSNFDSRSRVSTERRQKIETESKCNSFAGRSAAEWQDFDIPLTSPEIYYDEKSYWFLIDESSTPEISGAESKHFLQSL